MDEEEEEEVVVGVEGNGGNGGNEIFPCHRPMGFEWQSTLAGQWQRERESEM